jgi:hypothetical protein
MRVAIGNALSRALAVDLVPAADTNYPSRMLYDGPGWLGARFGGLDADPYIQVDLGGVLYGDGFGPGLSWYGDFLAYTGVTPPFGTFIETDWTVGNDPVSPGTTVLRVLDDSTAGSADHGGNNASLYVCGTDVGKPITVARYPVTLRVSARHYMKAWAHKIFTEDAGDAGSVNVGDVTVRLYSPRTQKYLKDDGTWTAVATDLVTAGAYDAGATWYGIAGGGVSFVTESATEVLGEEVDLELQLRTTAKTTAGRFDDISIVPYLDLMMVANGHNVPPAMAPVWATSDDGASFATKAVFEVERHQFWSLLVAPIVNRFHRFAMTGTPAEKLYLSDLILSLTTLLPRAAATLNLAPAEAQTRLTTPGRTRHISNRGPYAPRSLSFTFKMLTDPAFEAVRDSLFVASRGGAVPAVLFPALVESSLAIYGDLSAEIQFVRPEKGIPYRECSISIEEGAGFEIL